MASMSVSGIVSGMDWESMIDEIITNAAKPAQVKVNKKTNLTNKKSLFEEMKVTMNSLQSSLSALKLPSTYKAKTIDIERLDKNTSYKGVLTATANADASVNVWEVKVNKLATAQINRSKQITDSNLTSTLSGVSGKTIYIDAGGQKVGVEVKSSDTLESLKSRINTALTELDSPLYITASVVDNKLILKSDYTGKGTMTSKETVNYNYSTGINRLSNISIPSSAVDNVKITASGKSYVIHKDFEIANGNEIRWRQYDRGTEVALGDTVNVKYTMAADDVYEASGTYNGTEAEISGFSYVNDGTLADRLKIVEKNDSSKTYKYGTDFTITDNKVVWLDAQDATTNEPSSYTVTYNKTTTETSSATGTKTGGATVPTTYIVSYTKQLLSPVDVTATAGTYQTIPSLNFQNVATLDGLSPVASSAITGARYIVPDDSTEITLTDGTTDYVYGSDYILRSSTTSNTYPILSWNGDKNASANTVYIEDYAGASVTATNSKPTSGTLSLSYTHTYTSSNGISTDVLNAAGTDYANIVITDSSGNTYTYGNDFTIDSSGEIAWYSSGPSVDDAISSSDLADLQSNYNAYIGADADDDLPTITLLDSDRVMRTYFDPADRSLFTMTANDADTGDTISYEYGRDYVIRVNDAGDGYVFSWTVTGDKNKDLTVDIKDANSVVTAYTAEKGISTSGWKAAPSSTSAYNFTFSYDATTTKSETVSSSDTNKNIAALFSDSSIASSDITITSGSTTYTDYTIDGSGNIKWIEQTSATSPSHPVEDVSYTLTYEAFALTGTDTYNSSSTTQDVSLRDSYGGTAVTYEDILSYTGLTSSSSDSDFAKYFTLSDSDDKTYTYGTDYKLVEGTTGSTAIKWLDDGDKPNDSATFTLTMAGLETISTTVTRSASDTLSVDYADLDSGTVTITQGSKTYYEGVDFTLSSTGDDDSGNAVVNWIPDSEDGYEWYYPNPGSTYTINHTDDDGNTTTYSATRNSSSTLSMSDYGMTTANGSLVVNYNNDELSYKLDAPDSGSGDGRTVISGTYSVDITPTTGSSFNFRWLTPTQTTHSNLPSMNEELTVELSYDANTFDLSDDSDGDLLEALGFVDSSGDYVDYTAADDAELEIDGQTVTVDSNDIGADYENEVIKGVTLHLKGTGTVSLDISHDAEKAVESIQTFVDSYNDLMTWINTRMSEKQVDEDTAATIDSDDFRMRWGLLHGNSLLRNTKSQMRSLVSQNFTFSFTERKSSSEVYGRMSYNGLKSSSTLRLRIGSKYVDVTIDPDDTLETIVAKINDDTKNGPMHNIYYDDDGNKLQTPLLKASVQNDKLVINSTSSDEITMSGSAAMNALKMNYTYKGLYQIGIETTSDDYGKSGELVFDSDEFMTALEDNPDEVQSLMLAFANQFNTWTRSMLNSSSSGEVSGTLTREIENIQTQIDSINEYLESYQDRLDRMEESLRTRYGNTETQFSKLSQQANSIAAILNQLNGNASGGGYGQTSS